MQCDPQTSRTSNKHKGCKLQGPGVALYQLPARLSKFADTDFLGSHDLSLSISLRASTVKEEEEELGTQAAPV